LGLQIYAGFFVLQIFFLFFDPNNRLEDLLKAVDYFRESASLVASSTKAMPSGREERAAGSPASPPSRMLWTIGIWPSIGIPYFSAILRPPSRPKM